MQYAVHDGIARVLLNRPKRLNALNTEMHKLLLDALGTVANPDSGVRVLVIEGAGSAFCAGQDLEERRPVHGAPPTDLGLSVEQRYNPLARAIRDLDIPVVAAVNGVAAGAGSSLAFACDIVVAARPAVFIQSFAKLGLIPDTGGTWTVPRLVGMPRAMAMAMLAEQIPASLAEQWGLIWKCVDAEDFERTVDALARQLAASPTQSLRRIKRALYGAWCRTFEQQLEVERDFQRELGRSADYTEGVAAFFEKRPAHFTGS